jgi:hypothetical protein
LRLSEEDIRSMCMSPFNKLPTSQARGVGDGQDLGNLERGTPPRSVGEGPGLPVGRHQDQEDIQEAGEEEGHWLPATYYGVREV